MLTFKIERNEFNLFVILFFQIIITKRHMIMWVVSDIYQFYYSLVHNKQEYES